MLLPSPRPRSWFVFLQVAAAFVKYPPALTGKLIFQAFWGMSCKLETAVLALGRPHCHLWPPPSHKCLRPVFDLDKVQTVFKGHKCHKFYSIFGLFWARSQDSQHFPQNSQSHAPSCFPVCFFKRWVTPSSGMAPILLAAAVHLPHISSQQRNVSLPLLSPPSSKVMQRHCRFPPLQISHITSSLSSAPRGQMI